LCVAHSRFAARLNQPALPPPAAMTPDAVCDELREHGFVVVRRIIDPEALARARAHLEKAIGAHLDQACEAGAIQGDCTDRSLETGLARAYCDADPDAAPVSWVAQTKSSFVFQQLLLRDASLCQLIEHLLGRPATVASRFNVRSKLPGSESVNFPWHQDYAYFRLQYRVRKQPVRRLVAVWAPLLPTDAASGAIEFHRGSHRHGFVPHRRAGSFLEASDQPWVGGEAPSLEPGDVVIFTDLTMHRSGPNRTSGVRWTADWAFETEEADAVCPELHPTRQRAAAARSAARRLLRWLFGACTAALTRVGQLARGMLAALAALTAAALAAAACKYRSVA
jgi:ectoine hydroxylase-related dioxygenase (phytanoyl-CoA dioxygenase family)